MFKSYSDKLAPYGPVVLRLGVGIIFLAHGLLKLQNPAGVIGFFQFLNIPLPALFAWFILLLELVGGLALILGVATRWLGLLFAIEMFVATVVYKLPAGITFVTSGQPQAPDAGYELDVILLVASLALFLLGSGPLSVEKNVLKREL